MQQQTKTLEINGSPQKCFEAICDFESYPQWQKSIKEASILERENGRPVIVEYKLDALLKTITYTLRYEYYDTDPKNMILKWYYVGGDLKKIEGQYTFKELTSGKTLTTFALDVEIGIWAPKFVLDKFKDISMKESILSLKNRVEGCPA